MHLYLLRVTAEMKKGYRKRGKYFGGRGLDSFNARSLAKGTLWERVKDYFFCTTSDLNADLFIYIWVNPVTNYEY